MHDEMLYAERSLRAGAMGYITKEEATVNVLSAVRRVLGGQVYLSERMAGRMMKRMVGGAMDERRVAAGGADGPRAGGLPDAGPGLGTRQIAEELRLGIKTVESYRARIKEKLQLADGNQLLQHAIQWVQTGMKP